MSEPKIAMSLRFNASIYDQLKILMEGEGVSMTNLIIQAVTEFISKHNKIENIDTDNENYVIRVTKLIGTGKSNISIIFVPHDTECMSMYDVEVENLQPAIAKLQSMISWFATQNN